MGKLMLGAEKGLPKVIQQQQQQHSWDSGPGPPPNGSSSPQALPKAVLLRGNGVPPPDTEWHS